ncbi:MAG: hypothetical protein LBC42_03455 [Puniceicoccales bacterium]|jgi:hypothetical protein|nr:hypothetical protein [Puniceicoccales bacterium]
MDGFWKILRLVLQTLANEIPEEQRGTDRQANERYEGYTVIAELLGKCAFANKVSDFLKGFADINPEEFDREMEKVQLEYGIDFREKVDSVCNSLEEMVKLALPAADPEAVEEILHDMFVGQ